MSAAAPANVPPGWRQTVRGTALALGLGTTGGALFAWLGVPLPWMLGSLAATMVASLNGLNPALPRPLRNVMITVIGTLLGSTFTPALLPHAADWALSLASVPVWLALAVATAFAYYRRVAGFKTATSFFSAAPGGLTEMVVVGSGLGGDPRTISLVHSVRVAFVVLTIPIWYRIHYGFAGTARPPGVGLGDLSASDYLLLGACAVVGALVARRLRLPAAFVIGPMLVSAAIHLAGVTESKPPYLIVAAAQVVIGAAVGGRFAGTSLRRIAAISLHGLVSTAVLLIGTFVFCIGLSNLTGLSLPMLLLAFTPGGMTEVSLIALGLGVDPAPVAAHHALRLAVIMAVTPIAYRLLIGPAPKE